MKRIWIASPFGIVFQFPSYADISLHLLSPHIQDDDYPQTLCERSVERIVYRYAPVDDGELCADCLAEVTVALETAETSKEGA